MKMDLKVEQNLEKNLIEEKHRASAKITEILPPIILSDTEKLDYAEKYNEHTYK